MFQIHRTKMHPGRSRGLEGTGKSGLVQADPERTVSEQFFWDRIFINLAEKNIFRGEIRRIVTCNFRNRPDNAQGRTTRSMFCPFSDQSFEQSYVGNDSGWTDEVCLFESSNETLSVRNTLNFSEMGLQREACTLSRKPSDVPVPFSGLGAPFIHSVQSKKKERKSRKESCITNKSKLVWDILRKASHCSEAKTVVGIKVLKKAFLTQYSRPRRLYDILNVFEGLGLIRRVSEEGIKSVLMTPAGHWLANKDRVSEAGKVTTLPKKDKKNACLTTTTRNIWSAMCDIIGDPNGNLLTIQCLTTIMKEGNMSSKKRRVYDVFNILKALNIVSQKSALNDPIEFTPTGKLFGHYCIDRHQRCGNPALNMDGFETHIGPLKPTKRSFDVMETSDQAVSSFGLATDRLTSYSTPPKKRSRAI